MIVLLSIGCAPTPPVASFLPPPTGTADTAAPADTDPQRSYAGGWPVRPDRDDLPTGDWSRRPRVGELFPPLVGQDAHGESVHLYDFAGDAPVVLDLSTVWCGICRELSGWLAGATDAGFAPLELRDAVDDGRVRWITVLSEDSAGGPADLQDVRDWDASFPHARVPVLLDADARTAHYLRAFGYPRLVLLDADLRIVAHDLSYNETMALAVP